MAQTANAYAYQAQFAQIELDMSMPHKERRQDLGFELGWDFAHYGLTPPVEHLFAGSSLLQGWQAGRNSFAERTLKASRHMRMCLQLRTYALVRGLNFESLQVTANYLQQIDTEHCPITRRPLGTERSVDRVRHDAGYAAGNLVIMSRQANRAKACHSYQTADEIARSVAKGPIEEIACLGAEAWARLATLCSFVTELEHEDAARIPLLILPPNPLQLFNPIQALQVLITRQLAGQGWSQRLARLEDLLPKEALKADLNRFVMALVPRVLKASEFRPKHEVRWALEDAWSEELVQKRWQRFAQQLSSVQAESLVQKLAATRAMTVRIQHHETQRAIEGWALDAKGYRPATVRQPSNAKQLKVAQH